MKNDVFRIFVILLVFCLMLSFGIGGCGSTSTSEAEGGDAESNAEGGNAEITGNTVDNSVETGDQNIGSVSVEGDKTTIVHKAQVTFAELFKHIYDRNEAFIRLIVILTGIFWITGDLLPWKEFSWFRAKKKE